LLHDRVGQALALVKLRLGLLGRRISDPELEAELRGVRDEVDAVIGETRALTAEFAPPALFKLGLRAALESLVTDQVILAGLTVRVTESGSPASLPEPTQLLAWRAVRELLINVLKHADADAALVELAWRDGAVGIVVTDWGVGFDPTVLSPTSDQTPGFGLIHLRERLLHMGGSFAVRSRPGDGSRIELEIPAV
jgi:signal transduction histidine kinase